MRRFALIVFAAALASRPPPRPPASIRRSQGCRSRCAPTGSTCPKSTGLPARRRPRHVHAFQRPQASPGDGVADPHPQGARPARPPPLRLAHAASAATSAGTSPCSSSCSRKRGRYSGALDGYLGQETAAALRRYQRSLNSERRRHRRPAHAERDRQARPRSRAREDRDGRRRRRPTSSAPATSLTSIASRHKTTVAALARVNNLDIMKPIVIGQHLHIPVAPSRVPSPSPP